MLEIPESQTISIQLKKMLIGKIIKDVYVDTYHHGFACYSGDQKYYQELLNNKVITDVQSLARQVEISAGNARIVFTDGVNIRYFSPNEKLPEKHQFYLLLDDDTKIICTVQMYGGMMAFKEGENNDFYYLVAKEKPSPLSKEFDLPYFHSLLKDLKPTITAKAFLATEQRIPGLGNGVLHDILFNASIHPKRKINTLSKEELEKLYSSLKQTLSDMTELGGRDTEKNLFGYKGKYKTVLSSKTLKEPCPRCGGSITRKAYLGGNVYYCENCQPIEK